MIRSNRNFLHLPPHSLKSFFKPEDKKYNPIILGIDIANIMESEKFITVNKYIEKEWIDKSGFLRLRPDHLYNEGGMDGFFAALLKKIN